MRGQTPGHQGARPLGHHQGARPLGLRARRKGTDPLGRRRVQACPGAGLPPSRRRLDHMAGSGALPGSRCGQTTASAPQGGVRDSAWREQCANPRGNVPCHVWSECRQLTFPVPRRWVDHVLKPCHHAAPSTTPPQPAAEEGAFTVLKNRLRLDVEALRCVVMMARPGQVGCFGLRGGHAAATRDTRVSHGAAQDQGQLKGVQP